MTRWLLHDTDAKLSLCLTLRALLLVLLQGRELHQSQALGRGFQNAQPSLLLVPIAPAGLYTNGRSQIVLPSSPARVRVNLCLVCINTGEGEKKT